MRVCERRVFWIFSTILFISRAVHLAGYNCRNVRPLLKFFGYYQAGTLDTRTTIDLRQDMKNDFCEKMLWYVGSVRNLCNFRKYFWSDSLPNIKRLLTNLANTRKLQLSGKVYEISKRADKDWYFTLHFLCWHRVLSQLGCFRSLRSVYCVHRAVHRRFLSQRHQ